GGGSGGGGGFSGGGFGGSSGGFGGQPGAGFSGGQPGGGFSGGGFSGQPGLPGMGPMGGTGSAMGGAVGRPEWEHLLLDKPASAAEFKKMLETRGKEGWEFAGTVDFARERTTGSSTGTTGAGSGPTSGGGRSSGDTMVVFKRPKGGVGMRGFGGGG